MTTNRTKEEVWALIKSLNFAPTIASITGGSALRVTAADGSASTTIRRAPPTTTKTSNSGSR